MTLDLIINSFSNFFGNNPEIVVRSPGRINLLGEHTYYNDGLVLTTAFDREILIAAKKNTDNTLRLYSTDLNESVEIKIKELQKSETQWANYLLGVADQFLKTGFDFEGVDVAFGGDIPLGAGLASSGAIETGFAMALRELFGFDIDTIEMAKMARKAEFEYAGGRCGIMDQFTILHSKSGKAIKIDCQSLNFDYAPFEIDGYKLILADTKVKHALASVEYNKRRKECDTAVETLKKHYPDIESLRDVTLEMLNKYSFEMDDTIYRRAKYVIEENERVRRGFEALTENDIRELGRLMYQTHAGLRDDYEVSCEELDILFDVAANDPGVIGSRMMGGGFGGCTINIVKEESVEGFMEKASEKFEKATGQKPEFYDIKTAEGTSVMMGQE